MEEPIEVLDEENDFEAPPIKIDAGILDNDIKVKKIMPLQTKKQNWNESRNLNKP